MLFKIERVAPGVQFLYVRSGPWCGGSQRRRYNFVCLVPPVRTMLFVGFIGVLYALLVVCGRDVTYTANPDLVPAWLLPTDAEGGAGYLRSTITAVYLTAAGNIISTIGFALAAFMALETACVDPGLLLPDVPPDSDLAYTARHNAALNVNGIYAEHFDHDGSYRQACAAYRTSFCKTCLHYRPLKSAHCPQCGVCVLDMDHHCTVLGRCIGGRNLRYFLALMIVAAATGWRLGVQFLAFMLCRLGAAMGSPSLHGHRTCAHDHHTLITGPRDALAMLGMVASFAVAGGVSFLLSNYARSLCIPGAEAPRVGFWRRWCSKQAPAEAGDAASPTGETLSVAERIKATPIDPATGNPILSVPSWHPAYEAELKRWQLERDQAAAEDSAAELEKGQPADWRAAVRRYRERWLTLPWVHALAPRTPTMISVWLRERPVREWAVARRRGGVWYPNMQRKPLGVEDGDNDTTATNTTVEVAPMVADGEEEMEEFVA